MSKPVEIEGFRAIDLPSGTRYIACHYTADPGKRDDFRGLFPQVPKREWDREMEGVEDVWDGEPVYGEYRDDWHSPKAYRTMEIPTHPRAELFAGWDAGQTLQPAFVLAQVLPSPEWQVHVIAELAPESGVSMAEFAPMVARLIERRCPGRFHDINHFGDATITQRSGSNGVTAQQVAYQNGFLIRPSTNAKAPRISAVTKLLMDRLDEKTPRYVIDGLSCPTLREGFNGAYRFEVSTRGDESGQGRILMEPLKNGWSHVHDANQYMCMAIIGRMESWQSGVYRRES